MDYEYVVTQDFGPYKIGNVITDATEIKRLEATPRDLAKVSRRFAPKAPAPVEPAPAPKGKGASAS